MPNILMLAIEDGCLYSFSRQNAYMYMNIRPKNAHKSEIKELVENKRWELLAWEQV